MLTFAVKFKNFMRNQLVADSGSTKTDWALGSMRMKTQGINPIHQSEDMIRDILIHELLPQLGGLPIDAIRFYGSGTRADQEPKMRRLLQGAFPGVTDVEAHGDLLGAALALCGHDEGIACILGTGANSCLFDGRSIRENTPSMGYVLGDEGGGAVLGIRFLNALYKNRLSLDIKQKFESELNEDLSSVIDHVYRQPLANRWLASLSVFIHQHLDHPAVERLVIDNFCDFIDRNIAPYHREDLPISAVGSIAFYYQKQLACAAKEKGYAIGKILRSPIDQLVQME